MPKDRSLREKAISFKGKDYVLVAERIKFFNEEFEQGSITTEIVGNPQPATIEQYDAKLKKNIVVTGMMFIVKATVFTGDGRKFTGLSQAILGAQGANREAALENAETSAVGRALAMMGIGVIDSVASVDEMRKAGVPVVVTDDEFLR